PTEIDVALSCKKSPFITSITCPYENTQPTVSMMFFSQFSPLIHSSYIRDVPDLKSNSRHPSFFFGINNKKNRPGTCTMDCGGLLFRAKDTCKHYAMHKLFLYVYTLM